MPHDPMTPEDLRARLQRAIAVEQAGGTAAEALQAAFGDRPIRGDLRETRQEALDEARRAIFRIGRSS